MMISIHVTHKVRHHIHHIHRCMHFTVLYCTRYKANLLELRLPAQKSLLRNSLFGNLKKVSPAFN